MKENIFIAGACGLIGKTISKKLIKKYNLILFDTNSNGLKNLKLNNHNNFIKISGNISNHKDLSKAVKLASKKFGNIQFAINCTLPSTKKRKKFEDVNIKDLSNELKLHLGGTIIFSQVLIKHFNINKRGNLINFSSIFGVKAPSFENYNNTKMINPIEYGAIKSGIISVTKYLAKYLKNKNIRVNCISPGGIFNNQPKTFLKKYKSQSLNKGMLHPEDLVGTVEFLLSKDSEYINGQNIIIDDGWTL